MIIIRKNRCMLYVIAIGLFFTPYLLRDKLVTGGIYPINVLTWIGIFGITIWKSGISNRIKFNRKKLLTIGVYLLILLVFSFQGMQLRGSILADYIRFYIAVIAPIVIVFVELDDVKSMELFQATLRVLNFSILIITGMGVVDKVSGIKVSEFFANFYNVESLFSCLNQNRIVSFWGHSLLTAEIGILYFVLNYIDVLYFHSKRKRVGFVTIAFILVAMTGSKTAIALLLFMSLFVNLDRKNLKYIVLISLIVVGLLYSGVFDMMIERFLYWGARGDITSGRNSSFSELFQSGVLRFSLLYGNDIGISTTALIAATEYPIIRWAYRFGIVWTALLCGGIFIYPVLCIIKKSKSFKILILYFGFLVFVNTYSTLQTTQDGMLIFCVMTCIIMNVCSCVGGNKIEKY